MATRKAAALKPVATKSVASSRTARTAGKQSPSTDNHDRMPAMIPSPERASRSRKPVSSRDNAPAPTAKKPLRSKVVQKQVVEDGDREPIKAFLRIRPYLGEEEDLASPYLASLSDTTVQMMDPSGANRIRFHPQAQVYTFNHVFPPDTDQPEFFRNTTLPLVDDVLKGQNGLIFTYGVTNSGKTYTIQGGSQPNTAGLLPRALDVVFNSLRNVQGEPSYRPCGLASVERLKDGVSKPKLPELMDEEALAASLGELNLHGPDSTSLPVDKNYEYSVWISYVEVYNEKIYDLLAMGNDDSELGFTSGTASPQRMSGVPRAATSKKLPRSTSAAWTNLASLATSTSNDTLTVKRKALALKSDPDAGGKYAAGLKCLHVKSAEEAKRVFKMGNINRRVFGTLANAVSSRSHGIFTLRVVKVHRADPSDVTVSRLSIVDLAGSERTKNTHNTGERLKEAGSINKSLMVLGQCMEAVRSNQRRLASTLAAPGRGGLDHLNPGAGIKLAIVPFRHSKLTELFQDFFVGEHEGRAVMIVNVNPYDTGFDENSHVMRFAALAREVTTAPNGVIPKANVKRPPSPTKSAQKTRTQPPIHRKATLSLGGPGSKKGTETVIEIVEEGDSDDDDGPVDLLVDALFEELEDLRIRLFESEMRRSMVEAETREEVMQEMEARMTEMQKGFAKRLRQAVEQNEAKTDAKIDMLHHFGAFNGRKSKQEEPVSEDENTNDDDADETGSDASEDEIEASIEVDDSYDEPQESPLRNKRLLSKVQIGTEAKRKSGPVLGLRDQDMGIDEVDADDAKTEDSSDETSASESESGEEFDLSKVSESDEDEEDDAESYVPPLKKSVSKKRQEQEPKEDDPDSCVPLLKDSTGKAKMKESEVVEEAEDDADSYVPPLKASNSKLKTAKFDSSSPAKAKGKVTTGKLNASGGMNTLAKSMDTLSLFADELENEENVPPSPAEETATMKPKRQMTRKASNPVPSRPVRRSTRIS